MAKSIKIDEGTIGITMSRQEWTDAICQIVGQLAGCSPLKSQVGGCFDTVLVHEDGRLSRVVFSLEPAEVPKSQICMAFAVYNNGKPASSKSYPELNVGNGWDDNSFETFDEAVQYAHSWLGEYSPGLLHLSTLTVNVPRCIDNQDIEIRLVPKD